MISQNQVDKIRWTYKNKRQDPAVYRIKIPPFTGANKFGFAIANDTAKANEG